MKGVFYYALSRLENKHLAKDVVGETLKRFFEGVFKDKHPGEDPSGWVMGIAVNVTHEFSRQRKHQPLEDNSDETAEHKAELIDPTDYLGEQLCESEFQRLCLKARLRHTEILALSLYKEGLSYAEVGKELRISRQRARTIILKAQLKLRQIAPRGDWD